MVLEKEVESLKLTRSRLADTSNSQNDNKDISGATNLFRLETHRINEGMISGHSQIYTNLEVQQCIPLQHNELTNVAIQGSSRKAATATQSTSILQKESTTATKTVIKAMAREENVEENGRGRLMNADSSL